MKRETPLEPAAVIQNKDVIEYRSEAALINYISSDRVDTGFTAKELCQKMSAPRAGDEADLKRVARYLREFPQCSCEYIWQSPPSRATLLADSDWGGCEKIRRSTSRGCTLGTPSSEPLVENTTKRLLSS